MKHCTSRFALGSFALLGVLVAAPLHAEVTDYGSKDLQLGDDAIGLAVGFGDRVVAAPQTTGPVLGWIDTIDWRNDATQTSLDDIDDVRCIVAAGTAENPILLVGGDSVLLVDVDIDAAPAAIASQTDLPINNGVVDALVWDPDAEVAYGADTDNALLRWIPVTGASGSVDSEDGWPVSVSFAPTHLAMYDASTVLVAGGDGTPAVGLLDLDALTVTSLTLPVDSGRVVAARAAEDGGAWVLLDSGDLLRIEEGATGDDDDSVGDDDDSVGDDDDSAVGDDDDSAVGDDDDSAVGDDDDSAAARDLRDAAVTLVGSVGSGAVDLIARDGVVYVLSGNTVSSHDVGDADLRDSVSLSSAGVALAASSAADGNLYALLADTGLVSVVPGGPFLDVTDAPTTALGTSDDLEITFTAGVSGDSGTCTWTATLDGTIAGDGTALSATGDATLGESTTATIPADELDTGSHRVFLFCDAGDGVSRASVTYYQGDLPEIADVAATAGDARVVVTWTEPEDEEDVAGYEILFDTTTFAEGDEPSGSNADGTITSPISVELGTASFEVTGLANGSAYTFAVVAVDSDGNRGPLGTLAEAFPQVTGGIAALAGDPGCTCDYPAPTGRPALAFLVLPLLALIRRRRSGAC